MPLKKATHIPDELAFTFLFLLKKKKKKRKGQSITFGQIWKIHYNAGSGIILENLGKAPMVIFNQTQKDEDKPEQRRNPSRERKRPGYLDDYCMWFWRWCNYRSCAKHHLSCQGIIVILPSPSLLHLLVHLQNPLHPSLFCCLNFIIFIFSLCTHTSIHFCTLFFSTFLFFYFLFRKLHCNFYLFIDVKFCTF